MRIRLLYFAALRDLAGCAEEDFDLAGDAVTVGRVADELACRREEMNGRLASVRFAVNEAFASMDDRVIDGDVVALIPPVAGG